MLPRHSTWYDTHVTRISGDLRQRSLLSQLRRHVPSGDVQDDVLSVAAVDNLLGTLARPENLSGPRAAPCSTSGRMAMRQAAIEPACTTEPQWYTDPGCTCLLLSRRAVRFDQSNKMSNTRAAHNACRRVSSGATSCPLMPPSWWAILGLNQ
jgi:hypothetical protein